MSQQRITVPMDINKIKSKVAFGLTKRQLVCFSLGAVVAIPVWIATHKILPTDISTLCVVCLIIPFFITAFHEKNGKHLERVLYDFIRWKYIFPQVRKKGKEVINNGVNKNIKNKSIRRNKRKFNKKNI